jgi:hypothetical protein
MMEGRAARRGGVGDGRPPHHPVVTVELEMVEGVSAAGNRKGRVADK